MIPDPTDYLVTPDLTRPDKWTYPILHKDIAVMESMVEVDVYNTDRVKDVINNRTVAILLHGASVSQFKREISDFKGKDWCYLSLNRFTGVEGILKLIGKRLDILFMMSEQEMPLRYVDVMKYLGRNDNNVFMTTFSALSWLQHIQWKRLINKHQDKLYVMPRLLTRPVYPISLALILDQLVMMGAKRVILFGCDGYIPPKGVGMWDQGKMKNTYYESQAYVSEQRAVGLAIGTKHFNDTYNYNDKLITVLNCNPNTCIHQFPTITYAQAKEIC